MKKSTLPVSRKFYSDIYTRVHDAVMIATHGQKDYAERVFVAINAYITTGSVTTTEYDKILALTFALLRPEIDKAIERSRRARSRAAKKVTSSVSTTSTTPTTSNDSNAPTLQSSTPAPIETSQAAKTKATKPTVTINKSAAIPDKTATETTDKIVSGRTSASEITPDDKTLSVRPGNKTLSDGSVNKTLPDEPANGTLPDEPDLETPVPQLNRRQRRLIEMERRRTLRKTLRRKIS